MKRSSGRGSSVGFSVEGEVGGWFCSCVGGGEGSWLRLKSESIVGEVDVSRRAGSRLFERVYIITLEGAKVELRRWMAWSSRARMTVPVDREMEEVRRSRSIGPRRSCDLKLSALGYLGNCCLMPQAPI